MDNPLTVRELEVVKQIVKGHTYKEIAVSLGLGYETVKTYAARIRKKLGFNSKVLIALWAQEKGIVTDG